VVDPRTHAVRADLADIRLADRVFAPHYAAPLAMIAIEPTAILATASADAETVGILANSDLFDVLEIALSHCWGQRRADGIVGYVAAAMLRHVTDGDGKPAS
jgi:hypothetical protein